MRLKPNIIHRPTPPHPQKRHGIAKKRSVSIKGLMTPLESEKEVKTPMRYLCVTLITSATINMHFKKVQIPVPYQTFPFSPKVP